MLSPMDFEGAILHKAMEAEENAALMNQLTELEGASLESAMSLRGSLARLLVSLGLKLDPRVVKSLAAEQP